MSHPAFAIPLRRLGLPTTALAIGSLTPDLPVWAQMVGVGRPLRNAGWSYSATHSVTGILTLCLATGIVLWAWWLFIRRPLYDALPASWRNSNPDIDPWRRTRHRRGRGGNRSRIFTAGLSILGLWIGAASHVLVDEFTHEGRWAHTAIAWYDTLIAGVSVAQWAQYAGSVFGLVVVFLAIRSWLLERKGEDSELDSGAKEWVSTTAKALRNRRRLLMRTALIGGALVGMGKAVSVMLTAPFSYVVAYAGTVGVVWAAAGATLGAIMWHVVSQANRANLARPRDEGSRDTALQELAHATPPTPGASK
nr:DUF4184 family protein [Bowdeniella massiliensis]